jgi:hypothetical protein
MEMLRILTLIVQMGLPPAFPDGEASLQQPLADKIEVVCKDDASGQISTFHTLNNNPKFKKTEASLFTEENTKSLYIFLTQIDSTHLFIEDCDYSMLKFLRYKTKQQNLSYTVVDSTDFIVNEEKLRLFRWQGGIPVKIYDNNFVFETQFYAYMEYWQCIGKKDVTKYPFANPVSTPLRKNYNLDQSEDLKYILSHPTMVFSIIPLDDMSFDLPYNLEGTSAETMLETSKGNNIDGTGIDLNGDKILDAFWYHDIISAKAVEVFTRLYINVGGKWKPIWYTYFKEF